MRGKSKQPATTPTKEPLNEAMRERAYRQLRRLLILQQVPVGQRIRESEWTDKLKVNRSALREAFARLEAQGLIKIGPKTGYVVPDLNMANVLEILAVRVMLECGAIEIICESGLNTPQHLKPIIEACDDLERLQPEGQPALEVVDADWRFHNGIIDASRNKRLRAVYQHAPLPILLPDETSGPDWEASLRRTVQEHRSILNNMLSGNAGRATDLLRGHIADRAIVWAESHHHSL